MQSFYILFLFSWIVHSQETYASFGPRFISLAQLNKKIQQLTSQVYKSQIKHDQDYWPRYSTPPITWKKQKGLFESAVKLNFKGNAIMKQLRHVVEFPDGELTS